MARVPASPCGDVQVVRRGGIVRGFFTLASFVVVSVWRQTGPESGLWSESSDCRVTVRSQETACVGFRLLLTDPGPSGA